MPSPRCSVAILSLLLALYLISMGVTAASIPPQRRHPDSQPPSGPPVPFPLFDPEPYPDYPVRIKACTDANFKGECRAWEIATDKHVCHMVPTDMNNTITSISAYGPVPCYFYEYVIPHTHLQPSPPVSPFALRALFPSYKPAC
ncbi:unnamed protein product [Periconia digitata]|uniref:Uncharacterized protein n=1 Tax=Periconia digitata TaxID=1303443 RepID=A0A9W4UQJ5_9PLEO|nr:unnamed protein product [Periconia digitata]